MVAPILKACIRLTNRMPHYSLARCSSSLIQVQEVDGVRTISMCDSKTRNSLSLGMLDALSEALFQDNHSLRCVVLQSSVDKVYSSGHNLRELLPENGSDMHRKVFEQCARIMLEMNHFPVPIVAKIEGIAAAAGCQLVASCDIAVAAESARFSTPGISIGLFCSTPAVPVTRTVQPKAAALMLFTGSAVNANEAEKIGLISKSVPNDRLDDEADAIVKSILSKSKSVVALGKRFLNQQKNCDLQSAYSLATQQMVDNLKLKDAENGLKSFMNKTNPKWTHSNEYSKVV